jgi:hypothetical protein
MPGYCRYRIPDGTYFFTVKSLFTILRIERNSRLIHRKSIMSLRGIASAFAAVMLVVMAAIGVNMLQSHFGWSDATVSKLIFVACTLAILILTYRIRHLAFLYAAPIAKDKPIKLAPLHYFGLLIMAFGAILSVANTTGVFATFPYAGNIVLVAGIVIYLCIPPLNAQSIFKAQKVLQLPFLPRVLLIILFLLAVVGALIDITLSTLLPSEIGINIGVGCGTILAVCLVIISEKYRKQTGISINPSRPFQKLIQITWVRICVNLTLGFSVGFSASALGCPYVYTHIFGSQATRVVRVSGWNYGSSRRCSKPDIENSPFAMGEKALCVAKDARLSIPIGTNLILEGRESVFGFNVEKILSSRSGRPE